MMITEAEFYKRIALYRGKLISRLQKKLRRKNKKSAKQHTSLSDLKRNWREMQK